MPPGSGWPDDPADASTPVATTAAEVVALATVGTIRGRARRRGLGLPSLPPAGAVARGRGDREAPVVRRRALLGPADRGLGERASRGVLIVGLAPAAHGGNRTGRIFTGDRSGDWLFASLHRVGLAAQATSTHAGDGQQLINTRMLAAVRCAPPDNKPTIDERDTCSPWLDAELALVLPTVRAAVCLGSFAWDALLRALTRLEVAVPRPRPKFGHARIGGAQPTRVATHSSYSARITRASRTPSPAS